MDDGRAQQIEALRAMSPGERLAAAMRLYWSARALKRAGLRAAHPEWTDAEVERAVSDAFLYRRDH